MKDSFIITGPIEDVDLPALLKRIQEMPSVDDIINAFTAEAIARLADGNVYVGQFGADIIRDVIKRAIEYRISAL